MTDDEQVLWALATQCPDERFRMEIEFIELLANPSYLHFLAQRKYLQDPAMLNFLQYLHESWRTPKYVALLTHVHCLHFLEMLQSQEFREKLLDRGFIDHLEHTQFWHWRHSRSNRAFAGSGNASGE